jgi:hypothetical protein
MKFHLGLLLAVCCLLGIQAQSWYTPTGMGTGMTVGYTSSVLQQNITFLFSCSGLTPACITLGCQHLQPISDSKFLTFYLNSSVNCNSGDCLDLTFTGPTNTDCILCGSRVSGIKTLSNKLTEISPYSVPCSQTFRCDTALQYVFEFEDMSTGFFVESLNKTSCPVCGSPSGNPRVGGTPSGASSLQCNATFILFVLFIVLTPKRNVF